MKKFVLTLAKNHKVRSDSSARGEACKLLALHRIKFTSWDGEDLQFGSPIERDKAFRILHVALPNCSILKEDFKPSGKTVIYYKLRVHEN